MKRQWIQKHQRLTRFQIIGLSLISIGLIIFAGIAIASLNIFPLKTTPIDESKLVAIAILFIMIGFAFTYPELLMGPDKTTYSVMRTAVFFIICLFTFLIAKIGWNATSLADFQINAGWAAIITAALGSKAVQSLGENRAAADEKASVSVTIPGGKNNMFSASATMTDTLIHNPAQISQTPPTAPPPHI